MEVLDRDGRGRGGKASLGYLLPICEVDYRLVVPPEAITDRGL